MKYGIYDEKLGWITQDGKIVTSKEPDVLREVFTFGTVKRMWRFWGTVDLDSAYRTSKERTVVTAAAHEAGVDQIVGDLSDIMKLGQFK